MSKYKCFSKKASLETRVLLHFDIVLFAKVEKKTFIYYCTATISIFIKSALIKLRYILDKCVKGVKAVFLMWFLG